MQPLIEIRNLHKHYGELKAVDNLSLKIMPGQCFGLLGPNGAGKSTTIEVMEGIKSLTEGEILFKGLPVVDGFKKQIGIQFQSTALQDKMRVIEALKTFGSFYESCRPISELIEECDLGEFLNQECAKISGGQRQRLLLAIALINDPELIFLDEPTTGLDPNSRMRFWKLIERIKKRGKTILMTTHYMEEAHILCDQIVIVDRGKIVAEGAPNTLLSDHFQGVRISLPEVALKGVELPWKIEVVRNRVGFDSDDVNSALKELMNQGVDLAGLEIHAPSLDDLFLKLTGRSLEDA